MLKMSGIVLYHLSYYKSYFRSLNLLNYLAKTNLKKKLASVGKLRVLIINHNL